MKQSDVTQRVLGTILVGGSSRRFGSDKALQNLAGMTLLRHTIDRARSQVDELVLSGGGDPARYSAAALDTLPDAVAGEGPLAGILAGLNHAASHGFTHVASFPCDTPFFPLDTVTRLAAAFDRERSDYAVVTSATGEHRIFAFWPIACLSPLRTAFEAGLRKVESLDKILRKQAVEFRDADQGPQNDAFFNINHMTDLAAAETWIRTNRRS